MASDFTCVELHAHSYYSLLDGVSSPRALVARAAALGMPALALTDRFGTEELFEVVEHERAHLVIERRYGVVEVTVA